jgi:uncharacterized protein (TIGR02271 family)
MMGKTAVGLYATSAEAQGVLSDLIQAGYSRNNVRIMLGDQSSRELYEWDENLPESGRGARSQWAEGGATDALVAMGVPRSDARSYEAALHRGNALVSVATTDQRINEAVDIMRRHSMLNLGDDRSSWEKTASTGAAAASAAAANRSLKRDEEAILPVIEEELRVGKRQVEGGGVRVRTHVTETPVDETVELRQEHVEVERRPADRPIGADELNNLRDQTIEVKETGEEAVISKDARVVEEVVVRKDVDTRQEHIKDTVRRTDVEVEKLGGAPVHKEFEAWDLFGDEFHTHYNTHFANSGRVYTDYEPAYRYGYTLATRPDWQGRTWTEIEADARRQWEREYRDQGPWEDFKDAVRHAWARVTN